MEAQSAAMTPCNVSETYFLHSIDKFILYNWGFIIRCVAVLHRVILILGVNLFSKGIQTYALFCNVLLD